MLTFYNTCQAAFAVFWAVALLIAIRGGPPSGPSVQEAVQEQLIFPFMVEHQLAGARL